MIKKSLVFGLLLVLRLMFKLVLQFEFHLVFKFCGDVGHKSPRGLGFILRADFKRRASAWLLVELPREWRGYSGAAGRHNIVGWRGPVVSASPLQLLLSGA